MSNPSSASVRCFLPGIINGSNVYPDVITCCDFVSLLIVNEIAYTLIRLSSE